MREAEWEAARRRCTCNAWRFRCQQRGGGRPVDSTGQRHDSRKAKAFVVVDTVQPRRSSRHVTTRLSRKRCSVRPIGSVPRNAGNDLFQRELRRLPNLGNLLQTHRR
jgi:hypothetical protein